MKYFTPLVLSAEPNAVGNTENVNHDHSVDTKDSNTCQEPNGRSNLTSVNLATVHLHQMKKADTGLLARKNAADHVQMATVGLLQLTHAADHVSQ